MQRQGSIRTRLLVGYLFIALLAVFIGWFSYAQTRSVHDLFRQAVVVQGEIRDLASRIEERSLTIAAYTQEYFLWQDPVETSRIRVLVDDERRVTEELLRQLEQKAGTASEQLALGRIRLLLSQYHQEALACFEAHDAEGTFGEQSLQSLRAFATTRGQLNDALSQLDVVEQTALNTSTAATERILGFVLTVALVSIIVAVLATVLVGLYLSLRVLTPLRRLREGARAFGRGDLAHPIKVHTRDELEELAGALTSMAMRLQDTLAQEREQNEYLRTTVQRYVGTVAEVGRGNLAARVDVREQSRTPDDPLVALGLGLNATIASLQTMTTQVRDTVSQLSVVATQVLAATDQQSSGVTEQSAAIMQTSATINQVRVMATQAASHAQGVAELSRQTKEVSQRGEQSVTRAIQGMQEVGKKVATIAQYMQALSAQAETVDHIITAVNELAKRSNLLALNAAVEAARAGETGRGFAVVAQEVRALTEQSRAATAQVRGILGDIRASVEAAVEVTEEGVQGTEEGMALVEPARESIQELALHVVTSAQSAEQIAAVASQQLTGMEQITLAMHNIQSATGQMVTSTQQNEAAARSLNSLAERLRALAGQYQL